jgi:hypothetical protein
VKVHSLRSKFLGGAFLIKDLDPQRHGRLLDSVNLEDKLLIPYSDGIEVSSSPLMSDRPLYWQAVKVNLSIEIS